MKKLEEIALESFKSGLNCAQSVLTAYSEKLNFDLNLSLHISSGFGGGMGRLQDTCGAVTGAFMVLGIYNNNRSFGLEESREKTIENIQQFSNKFMMHNGSTNCGLLLNCDLKTEEGQKYFTDNNLGKTICSRCISDSINILTEIIK